MANTTGKTILVTGGAGYIGSHTTLRLLEEGHTVVVVDNLVNSSEESLRRVEELTGKAPVFYNVDLCEYEKVVEIFGKHDVDAVIHFAGLKAVGESVAQPLRYYENNLNGTIALMKAMNGAGVKSIVFSSSATVYGVPQYLPLDEDHPLSCTNPYGRTKLFLEDILRDQAVADAEWHVCLLRYFNPAGAHPSGRIGEDPNGPPNNLLPYISQVAVGRREQLSVFGDDYETKDGTGVRDFIHVCDLADGHLAALAKLDTFSCEAINLGTGNGYSVLEMIGAMKRASGRDIPYAVTPRRPGDVAACYAKPDKAREVLEWEAVRGLDEMVGDSWRWQEQNPNGYAAE